MLTLALDTALSACTVGLVREDRTLLHSVQIEAPRGHAERLVPLVNSLMQDVRNQGTSWPPTTIAVTLGPGSYTGLRVALAAARAFGLAWGAAVYGCDTLCPIYEAYRHHHPDHTQDIVVAHPAGRGWVYAQRWSAQAGMASSIQALQQTDLEAFATNALLLGSLARTASPTETSTAHTAYRFPSAVWIAECARQNPAGNLEALYVRAQNDTLVAKAF
jgi:tRNA threonylcarbamoyl adenosine modification protein YeaZ